MGKGLPRSRSRAIKSPQKAATLRQSFKVTKAFTVDGLTGNGFGTVVLGGLPEGNILLHGASLYMTATKTGASITTTFDGNVAVGSAATADATLAGSEVDIIPSTAYAAAVAGVTARTRAVNATPVMIDNTDKTKAINLNFLINDASISANAQGVSVVAEVDLVYSVLNDD